MTISGCLVKTNSSTVDLNVLYKDLQFQTKILRIQQTGGGGKVLFQADPFCYLGQALSFRVGCDFSLDSV